MKANPYLNFDGKCEAAFKFYKTVFGGKFGMVQRFSEMPDGGQKIPKKEANRIIHISLPVGDFVLMGSDISPSMGHVLKPGNNNYISLAPESVSEGRSIFNKLSKGGKIEMKYQKMFWGDYFGSFFDKFEIPWMINVTDKK